MKLRLCVVSVLALALLFVPRLWAQETAHDGLGCIVHRKQKRVSYQRNGRRESAMCRMNIFLVFSQSFTHEEV